MKDDGRGFEPRLQALQPTQMRFRLILPWTLGGTRIIGHRSRLGEEISLFRRSVDRRFQWFGIMPKATHSRFHRELGRGNRLDHEGKRCRTSWSRARNGRQTDAQAQTISQDKTVGIVAIEYLLQHHVALRFSAWRLDRQRTPQNLPSRSHPPSWR